MAKTKGFKSPKQRREKNKAQRAGLIENSSRQTHEPKKGWKWGKAQ